MIEVHPISMTQIDWPTYIRTCQLFLNQSPTRQLDQEKIDPKGPFPFIASIASFKGNPSQATKAVAGAGFTLRHFSFGFLISCPITVKDELMSNSELAIDEGYNATSTTYGLYMVTGNLLQWRQAIIHNLQNDSPSTQFRFMLNTVLGLFEQAGLVDLFRDFSKHPLIDKTFILTQHKR